MAPTMVQSDHYEVDADLLGLNASSRREPRHKRTSHTAAIALKIRHGRIERHCGMDLSVVHAEESGITLTVVCRLGGGSDGRVRRTCLARVRGGVSRILSRGASTNDLKHDKHNTGSGNKTRVHTLDALTLEAVDMGLNAIFITLGEPSNLVQHAHQEIVVHEFDRAGLEAFACVEAFACGCCLGRRGRGRGPSLGGS